MYNKCQCLINNWLTPVVNFEGYTESGLYEISVGLNYITTDKKSVR